VSYCRDAEKKGRAREWRNQVSTVERCWDGSVDEMVEEASE